MNETVRLVITIVHLAVCVVLIAIVILQSGKSANLSGVISGAADTFFGKTKARSIDKKLEKLTGWAAALFIVLTFVLTLFPS